VIDLRIELVVREKSPCISIRVQRQRLSSQEAAQLHDGVFVYFEYACESGQWLARRVA